MKKKPTVDKIPGLTLNYFRIERNISVKVLSIMSGFPAQKIYRLESGATPFKAAEIIEFTECLGITVTRFFNKCVKLRANKK